MLSLRHINALTPVERDRCYLSLVPPSFWERFQLDPARFTDIHGKPVASVEAPAGQTWSKISVKHQAEASDPAFFLKLDESRYGNLRITFIILNDPESPRFGVDLDDEGKITELGGRARNRREEESAMRAGLAPGQIRSGLRMLGPTLKRIDAFARLLGKASLLLEAFFYHNALLYERHGFGYLAGKDRMDAIHREFQPGGSLARRLDGSTPFRMSSAGATIRGRSWAIHDGILLHPWWPPAMYRPVEDRLEVSTASGIPF